MWDGTRNAFVKKSKRSHGRGKRGRVPPLWDGRAAERFANIINQL